MDWREYFFEVSELAESNALEDMYQAFKARLIEELQTNNSGHIGKLEERDE